MARAPCTFRERDVTRAIRAVEAAGKKVRKVELDKDRKVVVIVIAQEDDDAAVDSERNEWDAEYGADQTKVR
jgi:hypothetical protein